MRHILRSKRSRARRTKFGSREGESKKVALMRKTSFAWPEFRSLRTGTLATQATCDTVQLNASSLEFSTDPVEYTTEVRQLI